MPKVNFDPEKQLLEQFELWAQENGWEVSDGSELSLFLQKRTDVLLAHPQLDRQIRLSVLPKNRGSAGTIRVDASNLRTVDLVYFPRKSQWRVEAAGMRVE